MYVFHTFIIPTSQQLLAQQLCADIAGPAGQGMFTSGFSPTGNNPPTHFCSSGMIEQQFADLLNSGVDSIYSVCQSLNLPYSLSQIQSLLNASDISTDDWQTASSRLGIIQINQTS